MSVTTVTTITAATGSVFVGRFGERVGEGLPPRFCFFLFGLVAGVSGGMSGAVAAGNA